jgi:transcriptional regulator with PAS, ATPase and Fis domain
MQAQLDAQGKAIEATQGNLASAKTELTGSIAKTHDELVVLEKRGERSYFEFDLDKTKQFAHEGPMGVSLRKANVKHQYADLELMVEDRDLSQKHVNLNQPVMFYQSDTEQPLQVVVNSITKDHIHGYVSAPKYRKSELASMSDAASNGANAQGDADGIVGDTPTAPRKKLLVPQN